MSNPYRIYMFEGDLLTTEYTLVDADDYPELSKSKWRKNKDGYAHGQIRGTGMMLHRHIMQKRLHEKKEGYVIDHANGDKLNNTNSNLNFVSPSHSGQNRHFKVSESGFRGVCLTRENTYRSTVTYNHNRYTLGTFADAKEAAQIYDKTAIQLYGARARTNNLLSEQEIEKYAQNTLSEEDMIRDFRRSRELPTGVTKVGSRFRLICDAKYVGMFNTIEGAVVFSNKIKEMKRKEKENAHKSKSITRNTFGQAIIILGGEKKGETIVDDDIWYDLSRYAWCLS